MSRYTCEEVEKMIKDWLGRDVKDRVKELEEPLRKVWNSVYTYKIELNNNTGFKNLFSDTSPLFSIAEIICEGNWKSSATYIKLEREYGTLRLKGYDRIEECPNFVLALALELYKWDKEDVDKLLKVEDKWEYAETPSVHTHIEEYDMIVYKNGESVGKINVKKTYFLGSDGKSKCTVTIEGDGVNEKEGHLVIRSNRGKDPMEILNDFGYGEYDFKCE